METTTGTASYEDLVAEVRELRQELREVLGLVARFRPLLDRFEPMLEAKNLRTARKAFMGMDT